MVNMQDLRGLTTSIASLAIMGEHLLPLSLPAVRLDVIDVPLAWSHSKGQGLLPAPN